MEWYRSRVLTPAGPIFHNGDRVVLSDSMGNDRGRGCISSLREDAFERSGWAQGHFTYLVEFDDGQTRHESQMDLFAESEYDSETSKNRRTATTPLTQAPTLVRSPLMATTTAILAKAEEKRASIMKKAENRVACLTLSAPTSVPDVYLITNLSVSDDRPVIMGIYDSLSKAQAAYRGMIGADDADKVDWDATCDVECCRIVRVPFNTNAPSFTDEPFA